MVIMRRWLVKLLVFAIIFFTTFLATLLPLKVSHHFQRRGEQGINLLSYFTCFGGGVFLAMYMLEMAPDAANILQRYVTEPLRIDYNIAEFVTACGFLLMLVSEIVVQQLQGQHNHHNNYSTTKGNATTEQSIQCNLKEENILFNNACVDKKLKLSCELLPHSNDEECQSTQNETDNIAEQLYKLEHSNIEWDCHTKKFEWQKMNEVPTVNFHAHSHHSGVLNCQSDGSQPSIENSPKRGSEKVRSHSVSLVFDVFSNTTVGPLITISPNEKFATLLNIGLSEGLTPARSIGSQRLRVLAQHKKKVLCLTGKEKRYRAKDRTNLVNKQANRSIILLLALSLHHIFEGLSIGLKTTSAAVWHMCICIVSHEVIISFSLGMQLITTFSSKKQVTVAAALCAIVSPIGILLGMIIMETGGGNSNLVQIINGLLQSIATGIFIYITFFEILQDEFNRPTGNRIIKVTAVISGFLIISLLGFMPKDDMEYTNTSFGNSNSSSYCNGTKLSTE